MAKFVDVDAHVELWRAQDGAALLEGADWVIGVCYSSIRTRVKLLLKRGMQMRSIISAQKLNC